MVITYLVLKVNKLSKELAKYKMVWEEIRKTMNLQPRADPFVNNGESDGERHEGGETESETADVEIQDAEAPQLPLRGIAVGACHGAANNPPDDDEGDGHRRANPFGDGTRSRSPRSSTARGSTDAEVPVPKSMPNPLANAVARNQAMHVSDLIANMMAAQVAAQNDEVFYEHTRLVMKFYGMDPVPRDPNMLEDYRFEAINAGQGPETKLIRETREVRTWADRNLSMRQAGYRLLRHLQDLLVGLQSGDPELYAQAAREYRHFCEDGHNLDVWDAQTEAGDSPEGHGNDDDDEDWHFSEEGEELNVKMKKEKNGWKDLNLQTADSDDTRNQAKMKFPILKSGLISIFLKIENG